MGLRGGMVVGRRKGETCRMERSSIEGETRWGRRKKRGGKRRHWGRGPLETGVYMLGTLQALAESSSNVPTRYISFTFHM